MKIETDRLILRPFKKTDYKKVYEICSDYELVKTTLNIPYPYTEQFAKDFIDCCKQSLKEKKIYELAVCFKDNENTVVGCIKLCPERAKRAEIGYWIDRKFWGQGIATEAAKAIINFGFENLKLNSIYARHFDMNPASGKVMKKCGMKYVGIMRQHESRFDKFYDVIYYDILADDWKNICS